MLFPPKNKAQLLLLFRLLFLVCLGFAVALVASAEENSVQLRGGWHPAYKLSPQCQASAKLRPAEQKISFIQGSGSIEAVADSGRSLWIASTPDLAELSGGFDLNADGCPDIAVVRATGEGRCGMSVMKTRWVEIYSGATGKLLTATGKVEDKCWTHLNYSTASWYSGSIFHGTKPGAVALSPQYGSTGWFFGWDNKKDGATSIGAFYLPATASFDQTYPLAQPNPWRTGKKHVENSQPLNGFLATVDGTTRFIAFSSGRILQYAFTELGPKQLLKDSIYLARKDIAGRSYGLGQIDPAGNPATLFRVAGARAQTLLDDTLALRARRDCTAKPGTDPWACYSDPWGAIERNLVVYDIRTGSIDQRLFSYAHDAFQGKADGYRYQARVTFPARALLTGRHGHSHAAYNEFKDGRWRLHLSVEGGTRDLRVMDELYLWDIEDLDGDGAPELITSPTARGDKNHAGQAYYPEWKTQIYSFSRADASLKLVKELDGHLPKLLARFDTSGLAFDSYGSAHPRVSTTARDGTPSLLMIPRSAPHTVVELAL